MIRKIVFVLLLLCLGLCACNQTQTNGYNDYGNQTVGLTKSEAESKATAKLYVHLKALYLYVDDYDISQTRYSVASVTGSASSGYTVNGTYSLYDKYGNFEKRENFSVFVDSDGNATVTEY